MTKFAMVPVERTPQMIEAGRAEHEKTLIGGRDKVLLADERRWAGELSAATSPWRPISECPDTGESVIALMLCGSDFEIRELMACEAKLSAATHFMLASDFPLPVEGE